jgi:hypothetical protein
MNGEYQAGCERDNTKSAKEAGSCGTGASLPSRPFPSTMIFELVERKHALETQQIAINHKLTIVNELLSVLR